MGPPLGAPDHSLKITAAVRRGWGRGKNAASHLGKTGSEAKYPSLFNMSIRINVLSKLLVRLAQVPLDAPQPG